MNTPVGYLVDDDPGVLRALGRLLASAGIETEPYGSAASFLAAHDPARPGFAVLDIDMPGFDGISLQERLSATGRPRPVIFLTGHGTIPLAVRAMRLGAVDVLTKPVDADALIGAVETALARDAEVRTREGEAQDARQRLRSLTVRERQVLDEVIAGRLNKQIAAQLGTAEKTVKVHRGRMMRKMGVRSVADLVMLMARTQDS